MWVCVLCWVFLLLALQYHYQNQAPKFCWREKEDYWECLHHEKEFDRVRRIQEEYDKQFAWSKKLREEEAAKKRSPATKH